MINVLRKFIREELTWNYWMRRPRNNRLGDVSGEIQQQRQDVYASAAIDFSGDVQLLRQALSSAMTVSSLLDAVHRFGEDAKEIAEDLGAFARAIKNDDVDEVRRQLITGLERWEVEMLKWTEDDHDSQSLLNHPMRQITLGGSTVKRTSSS